MKQSTFDILIRILGAIMLVIAIIDLSKSLSNWYKPQRKPLSQVTAQPEEKMYTIGETAEVAGVKITMTSAASSVGDGSFVVPDEGKKFVGAFFEISNESNEDLAASTILSFEAYCDDYVTNISVEGLSAPEFEWVETMDGNLAAGKKMVGKIVYEVPNDFQTLEIRYKPSLLEEDKAIFEIPGSAVQ